MYSWTARQVLDAYRRRSLSPVEYVDALIERCEQVQPVVNALGDTYFDTARLEARRSADRYASRTGPLGSLEGLPIGVKDEAEIAGTRVTNGSLVWADYVSDHDEPMIERLRAAGAIFLARTLTPEFSSVAWTSSRMWGVTRNPWNPAFDVSGSSGGSAAALAAGMVPLATGSDIGGSIRTPASCCGVVGYKPTHGRVPLVAPYGLDMWCHLGPLARSVADVALMADAIVGPHRLDHASLRPALRLGQPVTDVRGLKVAVSYDLGDWPVVASVRAAIRQAADALAGAGALVDEVPLVIERRLMATAGDAHYGHGFIAGIIDTIAGSEDLVNDYVHRYIASLANPPTVADGLAAEAVIHERLGIVFERYDILLCPTACIPALDAGVNYFDESLLIDGVAYDAVRECFLTEPFNSASRCPVVVVPAGRADSGVPIGVQVVGRSFDDTTAIGVAAALEQVNPWPPVADPIPLTVSPSVGRESGAEQARGLIEPDA